MCRTNSIRNDGGYEVIRKFEGKITREEAIRRIVERHRNIQAAYDGGSHERH